MQDAECLHSVSEPRASPTDLRAPAPGQTRMPLLCAGAMQAATTLVIICTHAQTRESPSPSRPPQIALPDLARCRALSGALAPGLGRFTAQVAFHVC